MADEDRSPADRLAARSRAGALEALLARARAAPHEHGLLQLLRRVQHLARARLGEASRPVEEPLRLGQAASLAFAPAEIAALEPGAEGAPPRLVVHSFGMLGPNGPLPLHLTEYARDRLRNSGDPTLTRFLDVFHHRMLLFFFRAWAAGQPTVSRDHARQGQHGGDRFELYVGALEGLGLETMRRRDAFPDEAKLFYAGRLGGPRNAEGLAAVIGDFLGVPARVEAFRLERLVLPPSHQWLLGRADHPGRLGVATLGARVATRQSRFRLVLGPLARDAFQRLLPGGDALPKVTALVRNYAGDGLSWDVRLVLREEIDEPWRAGKARLGWTSWLGRVRNEGVTRHSDVVVDPRREERRQRRAAA